MKPLLVPLVAAFSAISALEAAEPPTLSLGSAAPEFDLPGVDDRNWKLVDFSGSKILVVIFTCNHCPTAQYYEQRIKDLVADYKGKDVAFVAISQNDPKSVRIDELGWTDLSDTLPEMKIRAKAKGFEFPYLYDGETQKVAQQYGPAVTPHVFVFDEARKLRYVGAIDDSERIANVKRHYLRDALDAMLAGNPPPVEKTKVAGCSTKWAGKEAQVKDYMDKLAAEPVTLEKADAKVLEDLRKNESGKLRLVNFWATWCAPCVAEFPDFITIKRMYKLRDFEFVTVSVNQPDEEKNVLEFLKKQQSSGRNLIFASSDREALINAFNPDWQGNVPYTVLISPEGKILYQESGAVDFLALKRLIVKELNDRKPW